MTTSEASSRNETTSNLRPWAYAAALVGAVSLATVTLATVLLAAGCAAHQPPRSVEASLEGRWESADCAPAPQPDGSTIYLRRAFRFEGSQWGLVLRTFPSSDCTTPAMQIDVGGIYALEGPSAQVAEAFDARFGRGSVSMTAMTAEVAALLSANGCGEGAWQPGQAQNVARGCLFLPPVTECPAEYDLVRTRGDRLWFGARTGSLCAPSGRPTTLDDHPMVRTDPMQVR